MNLGLMDPAFVGSLGGTTLWTPAQIARTAWFDALDSSTFTTTTNLVDQFRDKSGNNYHASATGTARPTYSGTGFNGLPTVDFTSTANVLTLVQFAQATGQNIFAVVDTTGLPTGQRFFMNRSGGTSTPALFLGASSLNYRPNVFVNSAARATQPTAIQRKVILRFAWYGSSALTQADDASPITESFTAGTNSNWSTISVAGGSGAIMKLSELLVTPADPSADDLLRLQGYFANRWLITGNLDASHPYKTSPPYA